MNEIQTNQFNRVRAALPDERYTVGMEYWNVIVVRYCGEKVTYGPATPQTTTNLLAAISDHYAKAKRRKCPVVVARHKSVLWTRDRGNRHCIAYGADVKYYGWSSEAATQFGHCVAHEARCEGLLD